MCSYPHIYLASAAAEVQGVKSLVDIAIDACIAHRHRLGDVGFMEASHLRRILAACNRTQLEAIEDATLAGSGRDLSWLSWDCWYVIISNLYGPPKQDTLIPLAGEPPVDYTPPPGQFAQPADYRAMVVEYEAATEARKAAAAARLRQGYRAEAQQREAVQVKYTSKLPPARRARRGTAILEQQQQVPPAHTGKTMAGKPAVKVLQGLGLAGGVKKSGVPTKLGFSNQQQPQKKTYGSGIYSTRTLPSSGTSARLVSSGCGTSNAGSGRQQGAPAGAAGAPRQQQQQQQRVGLVGQKRSAVDALTRLSGTTTPAAAAGSGVQRSVAGSRAGAVLLLDTPVALTQHRAGGAARGQLVKRTAALAGRQ